MKQSCVFRLGIAFTTAAMLLASGSAAAQGNSSGTKSQPQSANKGSHSDDGRDHHGKDDHGKGHHDELRVEIAALKDRVRRLEGHLTAAEVQGGYTLLLYQRLLGKGPTGNTNFLEHAVSAGTLQLNADGTMTYAGTELKFGTSWTTPATRIETNRPDGFSGSWQYAGGVLTLIIGGETARFVGGVGGRLFTTIDANGIDGTSTLITLVKNL